MNIPDPPTPGTAVPPRYRGVWARTLLQTPDLRDERTFVRWLQTSHRHADLRVPGEAREPPPRDAAAWRQLALQQGFCGRTEVLRLPQGEQCRWLREHDVQPPSRDPDAGWIAFESGDRMIETGVHGDYLEVWERLPGSSGRFVALERGDAGCERLLLAGRYLMRVRTRSAPWPADTAPGATLAQVLQAHPAQRDALLDFEISFGVLEDGVWSVERSTQPALEGRHFAMRLEREGPEHAHVEGLLGRGTWQLREWEAPLRVD